MSTGFVDDSTQEMIDSVVGEDAGGFPSGTGEVDLDRVFGTEGQTEETLHTGGTIQFEGCYHFEVENVEFNTGLLTEDGKENTPHVLVTCVVQHSVKGQSPAGSKLWHRIYVGTRDGSELKKGNIDSMHRFAVGLGLLKSAQLKSADGKITNGLVHHKKGTLGISVRDLAEAKGRHFLAWVKREKSNNPSYQDQFKIPMGTAYRPNHPDVSYVAKNLEALKIAGYVMDEPISDAAQTQQTTQKPAQQTQQTTQPAAKKFDVSDM